MNEIQKNIIENSSDILEYGIDFFTENEIVKDFPILGTVIKIGFTVKSISDRIFLKKIERFLFQFDLIKETELQNYIGKTLDDKERQKVGENLLLIIDRLSDLEKPTYLSICFYGYLSNKISLDIFLSLGQAIDSCHISDLTEFITNPDDEKCLDKVVKGGLAEISKNAVLVPQHGLSNVTLFTKTTDLGKTFLELWDSYNQRK
jgi:hypothetical protein